MTDQFILFDEPDESGKTKADQVEAEISFPVYECRKACMIGSKVFSPGERVNLLGEGSDYFGIQEVNLECSGKEIITGSRFMFKNHFIFIH